MYVCMYVCIYVHTYKHGAEARSILTSYAPKGLRSSRCKSPPRICVCICMYVYL